MPGSLSKHAKAVLRRIGLLLAVLVFARQFLHNTHQQTKNERRKLGSAGFPNGALEPRGDVDTSIEWADPISRTLAAESLKAQRPPSARPGLEVEYAFSPRYLRLERDVDSAALKPHATSVAGATRLAHVAIIIVAVDQDELDSACRLVSDRLPDWSALRYKSGEHVVSSVFIASADSFAWASCEAMFKDASFMVDLVGSTIASYEEAFQTAVTLVDETSSHVLAVEMSKGRASHVLAEDSLRRVVTALEAGAVPCALMSCLEYEATTGVVLSAGLEPIVQVDAELKHYYVGPYGGFMTPWNATLVSATGGKPSIATPLARPTCMLAQLSAVAPVGIPTHLAPGSRLRAVREAAKTGGGGGGDNSKPRPRSGTQVTVAEAIDNVQNRLADLEHCLISVGWYHVGASAETAEAFDRLLSKATLWQDAGRDVLVVTGTVFTRAERYRSTPPFEVFPSSVWSRLEANVTALAVAVVTSWQALRAQEVAQASRHPLSDSVVELALRLSQQGSSCATPALRLPVSMATPSKGGHTTAATQADSNNGSGAVVAVAGEYQATKVSSYLQMRTQPQLVALRNASLPIVAWYHQCCYCCGFSNEIVHLAVPLQRKYTLMMMAAPECFCSGFSPYASSVINNTGAAVEQYVGHRNRQEPVIWISHTTPAFYNQREFECNPPSYFVGRSMFEFTPVPEPWLVRSMIADEIWVPSIFVLDAFIASGFAKEKLVVVPEAIDASLFTPHRPQRYVLPHCIFDHIMDPKDAINVVSNVEIPDPFADKAFAAMVGASHIGPPFIVDDPFAAKRHHLHKHFKFLSAFKWEERKGWDILLRAYYTAFTRRDPVTLYIATSIFSADKSQYKHFRDADAVLRWCVNVSTLMGIAPEDAPAIVVITANLEEVEVAALYRSVDAFVLPSRGEGWGLPVMQAMASGLPTIATDYSGQKDFMPPGTAYPIRILGLEPIPKSNIGVVDVNAAMKWAVPDAKHCAELMRHVVENPDEARSIGARAAAYIAENFDETAVFEKHVEPQLQRITEILRSRPSPQGRGGIDC